MHRPTPLGRLVAAVFALLIVVPVGAARSDSVRENDLKAAYLYNFAKFATFPNSAFSSADAPFVVGLAGESSAWPAIEKLLAGKSVDGHRFSCVLVRSTREAANCRFLYIGSSEAARVRDWLAATKGSATLTIGDTDGFSAKGVSIELFILDNRLQFDVNLTGPKAGGISLSSRLLSLARE